MFRPMTSLYTRLAIAFLFILLSLGTFILWDTHRSSQRYFLEFTQRLNSPIAMYMAENSQLINAQGFDKAALQNLASHVMVINPSAEVYLLDKLGTVVAHSHEETPLKRTHISLEPIESFMQGEKPFPLLGDNPLDATEQRIFSAHPLSYGDQLFGYIYVILAGKQHETLLAKLTSSHAYKSMAWTIVCAILMAIFAGFLLFFKLTRRLQRLTSSVLMWHSNHIEGDQTLQIDSSGDEIDRLSTAYSAMTQQLVDQNQQLRDADQERREFYANISHDLRTPLTTLQGYLETISLKLSTLSNDQQRQHLHTALKQSRRLQHLITQLFDLTRLKSEHYQLNLEEFSILELSFDIIQDFALEAEKNAVDLKVRYLKAHTDSLTVSADIALIQRMFENLIDNALRYTPAGGNINIELRLLDDRVHVAVSDTGVGLSKKASNKIFDRHYSSTDDAGDTTHAGLGLSIVDHIADLHGAKVEVHSVLGKGTRFQFYLPAVQTNYIKQTNQVEVA